MARLRLRVVFDSGGMMGPGKADLLQGIAETGSIAAAGRRMRMSYKRAWTLVATLNEMFAEPLVFSSRGGAKGGAAELSSAGKQVLDAYRALETTSAHHGADEVRRIESLLAKPGRA